MLGDFRQFSFRAELENLAYTEYLNAFMMLKSDCLIGSISMWTLFLYQLTDHDIVFLSMLCDSS